MSADVAWPNWNCSRTISISQEQMLRVQIYKRRIAACNPIALLVQVWHQKSIWGCLTADNRLPPNEDAGAWTINILNILRILLCLKCLLCRWMDMPFSFQPTFSIQTTDIYLCMFRTAYLWGNQVNRHKIHKNHSDMNHLNFPHSQHNRIWKVWKMLKVHVHKIKSVTMLCRWWRSFRDLKNIVTTITHRHREYSVLLKLYCYDILLWD